jgi:TolA-binding protein
VWAAKLSAAYIIGKGKHMTPQEQVQLARYKEATVRSDDTIVALEKVIVAQREVIDLLHAQIGRMEGQLGELRAAL